MKTNNANKFGKIIYPELSYTLVGICFDVHNEFGRYAREKQYSNRVEEYLKSLRIPYKREARIGNSGNITDFIVDGKILLEFKTKFALTKEDYYQVQRYLQKSRFKLGLLVNFRSLYLRPKRVVLIEENPKIKFS